MELAHCSFLVRPIEQLAVSSNLFWDPFVLLCDLSSPRRPTPDLGICIFSLHTIRLGHRVWDLGAGSLCGWGSPVSPGQPFIASGLYKVTLLLPICGFALYPLVNVPA